MAIEIEKKYRLTQEQRRALLRRLPEVGALPDGEEEFEENVLYSGPGLDPRTRVLRLRRTGRRAVFTYKERTPSDNPVKRHREEETVVTDAGALAAILEALGFRPALVYEKRRTTWSVGGVEVMLDELPFGLFVEIEGEEEAIIKAEGLLELSSVEAEHATYPDLTERLGRDRDGVRESRFDH